MQNTDIQSKPVLNGSYHAEPPASSPRPDCADVIRLAGPRGATVVIRNDSAPEEASASRHRPTGPLERAPSRDLVVFVSLADAITSARTARDRVNAKGANPAAHRRTPRRGSAADAAADRQVASPKADGRLLRRLELLFLAAILVVGGYIAATPLAPGSAIDDVVIAATTQALFWLALPCSLFYMMILAEFDQRLFGQILPQGLAMKSFLLLGWFGLAVLVYVQWFKLIPQLWRSASFKSKANTFLPKNP